MKTALLFGSSGLVGGHLLRQLIENSEYSKIKIFVRLEPEVNDPKLEIIKTNFNNLENHRENIKGDDCFFCIGTTKQNSPNKDEYRRIELDMPKQIAQIAKSNSVNSFVFVSSGFADPKSSGDYLKFKGKKNYDINLEVLIKSENSKPTTVSKSNFKYMYWNMAQQLAHHTVNGCNINAGDLMASGTISGPDESEFGSMLELSWAGKKTIYLENGEERKFLKNGDTVIMRGHVKKNNIRIGFGELKNKIV